MRDNISRQAAVDEIRKCRFVVDAIEKIRGLPSATCDDCIWHVCNYNKINWDAQPKTGEWIKKPHKVYLPRDYEPDITDYHDCQYNEEDHSIIQYWWHCNQCDYEADRWMKPIFKFCPHCGARMVREDGEE